MPANPVDRLAATLTGEGTSPTAPARVRTGVVAAIDPTDVSASVTYGSGANAVTIAGHRWLLGHQPDIGDIVRVHVQQGIFWILGSIAAAMTASAAGTPAVRAERTSVGSAVANNSEVAVPFHAAAYNYGTMWAVGTPTDVVPAVAGVYDVKAGVSFDANATGRRIATIYVNGTPKARFEPHGAPGSATVAWAGNVSTELLLAAGDVVQVRVYQNSGGGLLYNSFIHPWLAVSYKRAA